MIQTYAEVNLSIIWSNYLELVRLNEGKPIIAVVKADSYGHGANEIVKFLFSKGIKRFALAKIEEFFSLLESFSSGEEKKIIKEAEILIFCPIQHRFLEYLARFPNIIPIVSDVNFLVELNNFAYSRNMILKFGVEIDTGMGRLGIRYEDSKKLFEVFGSLKNLEMTDLMTHFPSSDFDREFSLYQLSLFDEVVRKMRRFFPNVKTHVSNSGGVLNIPEASKYDFARCGLSIYGYYPNMDLKNKARIRNSLTLKSYIALKKFFRKGESISYNRTYFMDSDGYVGIIPCGYADGIPTLYSNNMNVVINNNLFPVVGRVTMDYIMVRIDNSVNVGDEVIIFGGDNEKLRIEYFSSKAGLIPYEITCGISKRVPRVYVL